MIDWPHLHGDHFTNSRVLVTGGAGFIGSHLVEALVALGADVVALDDLSGGSWSNLERFGESVDQRTASILDEAELSSAAEGCRYVFHQAALGSVPRSLKEPFSYLATNVRGTANVLQAAREAQTERVLFASSSSVYGNPPDEAARTEDQPMRPLSPYAASKAAAEQMLIAWVSSYGLDAVALRYFNVFGPRQNANSVYAAVIAAFSKAMREGEPATIYGDGEQARDFTYVANVVHGNLLAARSGEPICGQAINIACGGKITVNELHAEMSRLFESVIPPALHAEPRAGEVRTSQADVQKASAMLGFEPIVSFQEGLNALLESRQEASGHGV